MPSRGEKIDHLALGVGPGIGAAGASDPGLLASEQGYRFFQLPLDRRMTCLKLESGVARPLVFNQKGGPPKLPAGSVLWLVFRVLGSTFFYLKTTSGSNINPDCPLS